jgi:hypothetical protein
MSDQPEVNFARRPLGCQRSAVDDYVAQQNATLKNYAARLDARTRQVSAMVEESRVLEAEVERFRSASPVFNASEEISALLQSFAVNVSTMREQAERDAASTRSAADAYVEDRRSEGDRLLSESRAKIADVVQAARDEIQTLAHARESNEGSLKDVAGGLQFLLSRLEARGDPTPFDLDAYLPPGVRPNPEDSGVTTDDSGITAERPAPDTLSASGVEGPAEGDVSPLIPVQFDPDHDAIIGFEPRATPTEEE